MLSKLIFENLVFNKEYSKQVYPFLKPEYFKGHEKFVFQVMQRYVNKYNAIPNKDAILIEIEQIKKVSPKDFTKSIEFINSLENNNSDLQWITDATEKFCKDTALFNAITEVIEIQNNAELVEEEQNPKLPNVGIIPEILQKALSVGFDRDIGHDYFNDAEKRYDSNNNKASKIPFKLNILNQLTNGGVESGTLNLLLGGTNVGKTLGLIELASQYLEIGKNVLYITLEISEEKVGQRIDANIMDVSLDNFDTLTKNSYLSKLKKFKEKHTCGKLFIKQYPPTGASAIDFRNLINELKLKKDFKPDVIIVDYLGICGSFKIRFQADSYSYQKAVAEELRGIGIEYKCAVWSAVQTNKAAWSSSSFGLDSIADSAAVVHTADFVLAMIETDELVELGQQLFLHLKSRYADKSKIKKIFLGVSKGKQAWYELDNQPVTVSKTIEKQVEDLDSVFNSNKQKTLDLAKDINF